VGGGHSNVDFGQEFPAEKGSVRRYVVMMQQRVLLLPNFVGKVFARFQVVTVKHHSSMRN
jgi:hypothetical protein